MSQAIVPHLWFDKEAVEAAGFYAKVFPDSKVTFTDQMHDTPSGDVDVVGFEVMGFKFMAISAGPMFKLNPAISFLINFDPSQDPQAAEKIDEIWGKLMDGGTALMPLQEYPFSKRYGWVQDKYGVSWQLILTDPQGEERPAIIPSLLFVNERYGKAEEALRFYTEVFSGTPINTNDTKLGNVATYESDHGPNKQGTLMFGEAKLLDTWITAMDGGGKHAFDFNEAISLMVNCDNQEQIDYLWDKLSAVPEAEQCGWLKDKYGVSWQIVPKMQGKLMSSPEAVRRFLKMKKITIADLEEVHSEK